MTACGLLADMVEGGRRAGECLTHNIGREGGGKFAVKEGGRRGGQFASWEACRAGRLWLVEVEFKG